MAREYDTSTRSRSETNWVPLLLLGGLVLLGLYFLSRADGLNLGSLTNTTNTPSLNSDTVNQSQAIQALDAISENPEAFIGQQVTVRGEVENVVSDNVFVLDVPGEAVNDEILVISETPISPSVAEANNLFDDGEATIEGEVRRFVYADVVNEVDPDANAEVMAVFEGRPYILARNIQSP